MPSERSCAGEDIVAGSRSTWRVGIVVCLVCLFGCSKKAKEMDDPEMREGEKPPKEGEEQERWAWAHASLCRSAPSFSTVV